MEPRGFVAMGIRGNKFRGSFLEVTLSSCEDLRLCPAYQGTVKGKECLLETNKKKILAL